MHAYYIYRYTCAKPRSRVCRVRRCRLKGNRKRGEGLSENTNGSLNSTPRFELPGAIILFLLSFLLLQDYLAISTFERNRLTHEHLHARYLIVGFERANNTFYVSVTIRIERAMHLKRQMTSYSVRWFRRDFEDRRTLFRYIDVNCDIRQISKIISS